VVVMICSCRLLVFVRHERRMWPNKSNDKVVHALREIFALTRRS
jgi:hypothetical protein